MKKNEFIVNTLKEIGFTNFLGKKNIFVRYNPGWDYTTKITLIENKSGFYTYFDLEKSYKCGTKIKNALIPYTKTALNTVFYIANEPFKLS